MPVVPAGVSKINLGGAACPRHRVLELAPAYWSETLEQRETQEKLDANVFRRVVLGLPVGFADHAPELHRPDDAVSDG